MDLTDPWVAVGFGGQALFSMRCIYHWFQSEREKRSRIPVAFWYFSLEGGATLLAYAIYRLDPVFIVGQGTGLLIYARNIYFIHRDKRRTATGRADKTADDRPAP